MISWISSYHNDEFLFRNYWLPNAYAMRDHVEAILVDDHSTEVTAKQVFEESGFDMPIKIFYVTEELGFNSHGCRNLGAAEASNETLLLTDQDKTIGSVGMYHIINMHCQRGEFYRLLNWGDSGSGIVKPSANNFVLNRNDFMQVKGYNEELAGSRHGDALFRRVLSTVAREKTHELLRCVCLEKSNPPRDRKSMENRALERKWNPIEMQRAINKDFSDKAFINFEYERQI